MASPARLAADQELSEIVRRRLQTLLAEVPPRRAVTGLPATTEQPPATSGGDDAPATGLEQTTGPAAVNPADDELRDRPPSMWATLPELGPRARQFLREHLLAVGVIMLTGCLWGGYSLFQARTTAVTAAAPSPAVQVSLATPSASPSLSVLVHVLGEVKRPGVVRLAPGSRVQDAVAAAGGLTSKAVPGDLNLAAPVGDGAQLLIGRTGSRIRATVSAGGVPGAPAGAAIDLNAATVEQLDTLPGVGPVTAQKILAWREAHERFRSVAELQEVDGIGPKSFAQIAPHVRV